MFMDWVSFCAFYVRRVRFPFAPQEPIFIVLWGDTALVENADPGSSIILNSCAFKITVRLPENGILELVGVDNLLGLR